MYATGAWQTFPPSTWDVHPLASPLETWAVNLIAWNARKSSVSALCPPIWYFIYTLLFCRRWMCIERDTCERRPITHDILLEIISRFDQTTLEWANLYAAFCSAFAGFFMNGQVHLRQGRKWLWLLELTRGSEMEVKLLPALYGNTPDWIHNASHRHQLSFSTPFPPAPDPKSHD